MAVRLVSRGRGSRVAYTESAINHLQCPHAKKTSRRHLRLSQKYGCSLLYIAIALRVNHKPARYIAWHCYIGRLLSQGKMRFSTSRPGNTMNIWELNLAASITR